MHQCTDLVWKTHDFIIKKKKETRFCFCNNLSFTYYIKVSKYMLKQYNIII
jgi:hypothetical protein